MPDAVRSTDDADAVLQECARIARTDAHRAASLAQSVLDTDSSAREQLRALVCLGQARATLGEPDAAAATVSQLLERLDRQPRIDSEDAFLLGQAGGVLQTIGQNRRAAELYERSHALVREDGSPRAQVISLLNLAGLHAGALDDPETADPYLRDAIALAEANGIATSYMYFNYGLNLSRLGRDDEAMAALDRTAELAQGHDDQAGVMQRARSLRGELLTRRGDFAPARALLEAVVQAQRQLPDVQGEVATRRRLSALELAEQRPQAALDHAQRALELSEQGHFPEDTREVLRQLDAVYRALGRHEDAAAITARRHALEIDALARQNHRSIAAIQAELGDQERTRQLERLQYQNEIQRLTVDRSTATRNVALVVLAAVLVFGAALLLSQRRINRRLRELSATDPLTGLTNRRLGSRRLSDLAEGRGYRSVLLLIDVDRFKAINDEYGHPFGDEVLVELASRLARLCRDDDLVARWGGEEFLIACRQPDFAHAQAFAERLRRCVAETPIRARNGEQQTVTVSIGFAPIPLFPDDDADWHGVLALADRALYAAKRAGRDAWAGVWNADGKDHGVDAATLARDLPGARLSGRIVLASSRSTVWE